MTQLSDREARQLAKKQQAVQERQKAQRALAHERAAHANAAKRMKITLSAPDKPEVKS